MDSDQVTESDTSDWETPTQYSEPNITLPPGVYGTDTSGESDDYRDSRHYGDKRKFPNMYDTMIDSPVHDSPEPQSKRSHEDDRGYYGYQQAQGQGQFDTSSRSIDSALGSSLYTVHETPGSQMEMSGSCDTNSEGNVSNSDSPVHNPVYGRYQKIKPQSLQQKPRYTENGELLETLMLHRLPGENLGMILGIEGGKDGIGTVLAVSVKSVTVGGAAHRATGSSKGICVGDEILEVNGTSLRTLSHDECITVFKEMPLRVVLTLKRGQKDLPPVEISPLQIDHTIDRNQELHCRHDNSNRLDTSDSEDDGIGNFGLYEVTVTKEPEENLGLSIVPSYGSTKEFYQIKRILPSGAAARCGQLKVGDRLISCNGDNLQGLTQNHCLNILKSASGKGDVDFEILRPIDDGSPMEISVTLNNNSNSSSVPGYDSSQFSLKSLSYDRHVDVVVTSESEEYLTVSEDEYSRTCRLQDIPETNASEVFAEAQSRLAFKKPFTPIEEIDTTEAETETETESVHEDEESSTGSGTENQYLSPDVDIVDLNAVKTSPYHIPVKKDQTESIPSPSYRSSPRQRVPVATETPSYPQEEEKEEAGLAPDESELSSIDVALPPPLEFSDYPEDQECTSPQVQDQNQISETFNLPYTNIDDIIPASDTDKTPTHHIQVIAVSPQGRRSEIPDMELDTGLQLESGKTIEKVSPEDQNGYDNEGDLAFNTEVTVSNDTIDQDLIQADDKDLLVNSPRVPDEFADSGEEQVLEVVQNDISGQITVTQYTNKSQPSGFVKPDTMATDITMDTSSEAMLKSALDMEYDNLPETSQVHSRLALGSGLTEEEPDLTVTSVVDMLAQEMSEQEQAGAGSYTESDEEPDQFPDADQPEALPDDLAQEFSHILVKNSTTPVASEEPEEVMTSTEGLSVKLVPSTSSKIQSKPEVSVRTVFKNGNDPKSDTTMNKVQPSVVVTVSNTNPDQEVLDEPVVVPRKLERKTVIPVDMATRYKDEDSNGDVIVPVKVERKFEIPSARIELVPRQVSPPLDEIIVETKPVVTVTTGKSPKPKVPPKPSPRKKENVAVIETEVPVEEPIVPTEAKRDQAKSVVNVLRVVNAMKDGAAKSDDDGVKKTVSSVINVGLKEENDVLVPSEPVKKENVQRTVLNVEQKRESSVSVKEPELSVKTSIIVEKPQHMVTQTASGKETDEIPQYSKETVSKPADVTVISVQKQPTNEIPKSTPQKPETTVNVTKEPGNIPKPTLAPHPQIKPITQIKPLSFNPKTLSKPTQYKTTVSTVGMKPSGLSPLSRSSVLNPPKVEHPIKRMETMPFEVSILKGILGIGIKVAVTSEGYVTVTEILPSGPVGREGNIKVGDYLLSINNTDLTGLPDSKVQQILRLLPRGLSKIVASAVRPEAGDLNKNVAEKKTVTPQQSLPPSSNRYPTITTEPKPTLLTSPRQPIVPTKSLPISLSKPVSPLSSPREVQKSPISPRQQQSPTSPKQPPPVAPKPKRSPVTENGNMVLSSKTDETGPINAEIFVSVSVPSASQSASNKPLNNILPGSVRYDTVETSDKSWTPGVVSSTSASRPITAQDLIGEGGVAVTGKIDVVDTDAPTVETDMKVSRDQQLHEIPQSDDSKLNSDTETEHADKHLEEQADENTASISSPAEKETTVESADKKPEKFTFRASSIASDDEDDSLPTASRQRTLSTGSDTSYTEFKECTVEDESIPEEVEEQETVSGETSQQFTTPPTGEVLIDFDISEEIKEPEDVTVRNILDLPEENVTQAPEEKSMAESEVSANKVYEIPPLDLVGIIGEEQEEIENTMTNSADEPREQEEFPPEEFSPVPASQKEREIELPPLQSPAEEPDMVQLKNMAETIVSNVIESVKEMNLNFEHYEEDFEKDDSSDSNTESKVENSVAMDMVDAGVTDSAEELSDAPPIPSEAPPPLPKTPPPDFDVETKIQNKIPDSISQSPENVAQEIFEFSQSSPVHAEAPVIAAPEDLDLSSFHGDSSQTNDSLFTQVVDEADKEEVAGDDSAVGNVILVDSVEEKTEMKQDNSDYQSISDVISMYSDINKSNDSGVVSDDTSSVDLKLCEPELNIIETSGFQTTTTQEVVMDSKPVSLPELGPSRSSEADENGLPLSPRSDSSSEVSPLRRSGGMNYSEDVERMIRVMSLSDEPQEGNGEVIRVTMTKGVTGLGFVIQGGKGSPKGDVPISIKRIFKGGPADSGQLRVKDELLEVNGEDITDMKHSEAWHHLKFLPSGEISLTVRRYTSVAPEEV